MRKLGLTILGVMMACSLFCGCNRARNLSIEKMNQGIRQTRDKQFRSALESFAEAAALDPSHSKPLYYRGMVEFQKLDHVDQAEVDLRKAVQLDPDEGEYHYLLGQVLERKDDHTGAVVEFTEASKCSPDHGESQLRLGMSLEKIGRIDDAQAAYRQAILVNPYLPEAYNMLGNLYARYEKNDHAAQVLEQGIKHNGSFAANYRELGMVYQTQKRYGEAAQQFEKAILLDPSHPGDFFNLGMTYASNNDAPNAIKNLRLFLQRGNTPENLMRLQIAQDTIDKLEGKKRPQ